LVFRANLCDVCLAGGLAVGVLIRKTVLATAIYASGTYFPRLSSQLRRSLSLRFSRGHGKVGAVPSAGGGRLFGLILLAYMVLVLHLWFTYDLGFPSSPNATYFARVTVLGFRQWLQQVGQSFSTLFSDQPSIQVLISAVVIDIWQQ